MKQQTVFNPLSLIAIAIIVLTGCSKTSGADTLNSFFANEEIPEITVEEAVEKGTISYCGIHNGEFIAKKLEISFKKVGDKVELSGNDYYGDWGNEYDGSIEGNRLILKGLGGECDFMNVPFTNLTYFIESNHEFSTVWIDEEVFNRIKAATPTIVYASEDGTKLEMQYFRDFWGDDDIKAFGQMKLKNLSSDFFNHMDFEYVVDYETRGFQMENFKYYFGGGEDGWTFVVTKDNQIKMELCLFEDGLINIEGEWGVDTLTFTGNDLEPYTFTRQN